MFDFYINIKPILQINRAQRDEFSSINMAVFRGPVPDL